jgi:hypothetical protein
LRPNVWPVMCFPEKLQNACDRLAAFCARHYRA